MSDPTMALTMHRYDSLMIGRQLSTLANKKIFDITSGSVEFNRVFTILRGERYPMKRNGHVVPQAENSTFQKA